MKLVEKLIEIRLLSDGFFFRVLYLNFGPAADSHTKENLSCKNTDQGDGIGVKLEAKFQFGSFCITECKDI
jgi:hypothetical protein